MSNQMLSAIETALQSAADHAMQEIENRAVQDLRERLREKRAQIVMNVMSYYDVRQMEGRIVITVRDGNQGQPA